MGVPLKGGRGCGLGEVLELGWEGRGSMGGLRLGWRLLLEGAIQ
jgi:hypothetical protein